LPAGFLQQTKTWKTIVAQIETACTLIYLKTLPLQMGDYAIERMLQVITDTSLK